MPKKLETGGVDLSEHEEITDITFAEKGAHLAVVHALQQPANGCPEPLMLKAEGGDQELIKALEQVQLTLSMEEYLRKFMGMWYDDAELLTKLLGMQTEEEYREEMEESGECMPYSWELEARLDKVKLLSEASPEAIAMPMDKMDKDLREAAVQALTELTKGLAKDDNLTLFNEYVEKSNASGEASKEALIKSATSEAPSVKPKGATTKQTVKAPVTKGKKETMTTKKTDATSAETSVEDLLKSDAVATHLQELIKAETLKVEEAAKAELEKVKADMEKAAQVELEKAAARVEALEKAETVRVEKAVTNMTDSWSYLDDESKPEVVKAIMSIKTSDAESAATVIAALEKAQEGMKAATETEVGFEGVKMEKSATADLDAMIEAKYGNKKI